VQEVRVVVMRRALLVVLALVAVSVAANTSGSDTGGSSESVSPIRNPSGTRPGLRPVADADRARARAIVHRVRVGSPELGGYDRGAFGPAWTDSSGAAFGHNGCRTRDDVLSRDLVGERRRDRCVVVSGSLSDPYTGRTIEFSKQHAQAVQIDHVVALGYAWRQGAARWSAARRERLANDPLNLLAVDGPENVRKSDRGPSRWMPPREDERCAFAVRVAQVVVRYRLVVTPDDDRAMLEACS